MIAELWDRILATQPLPSARVVAATAALALLLVLVPWLWRVTRHVVTVAHEGGHAIAAVVSGRRLTGIRLHSDTSGLTVSRGRPRGPGMVVTLLAGYTGPALVGLAAAALLSTGRAVALLWSVLLLLTLLLLQIRNLFGLWVVLVCGAGVVAVTWWLEPALQFAVALTLTWFLLLGAPRAVLELVASRRTGPRTSDPDQLARLTRVPAGIWVGILLAVTVAAAAGGVALLLPDVLDVLRTGLAAG
ncbi:MULTISPECIES: M50 family metallopeptidase [unclassified Actinotalea]|uniref:M50 family metallopeptidase n=1 Tax=unclassified Actinotalea TaxID=2638618 RepID=UPI001C715AB2|nr:MULTISPECIES: M50 family metallopeptidase [unclassified Actinotalea]